MMGRPSVSTLTSSLSLSLDTTSSTDDDSSTAQYTTIDQRTSSCCFARFDTSTCTIDDKMLRETKANWRLSWPLIIIIFSNYAMEPITLMFGGHLGKLELDALALATSIISIFGWSTLYGFGTVCDTLFAQTYGSRNYRMMGIYLQRCVIMFALFLPTIIALLINVDVFMVAIGQDPEVARMCGEYIQVFIPALIFMWFYYVLREYIYTQNIVYPDMFISVSAFIIHIILQYVFINTIEWGLTGSAVGQIIVNVYLFATTFGYFILSGLYRKTWFGWTESCLEGWGDIFKLGTYGLLLTCLEWWAFEITIILSGLLGTTQLAAQSIVFNIDQIMYSLTGAISSAAAIRVGWHLGANDPQAALRSTSVGIVLCGSFSIVIILIVIAFHQQLPKLFTDEKEVIELAANLLPFIAVYAFFDSIFGVGRAVARGAGMQKIGTLVVFVAYYCVALPVGLPLMFLTPLHLYGIWIALVAALIIGMVVFVMIIYCVFDWQALAGEALNRSGVYKGRIHDGDENEQAPLIDEEAAQRTKYSSTDRGYESDNWTLVSFDSTRTHSVYEDSIEKPVAYFNHNVRVTRTTKLVRFMTVLAVVLVLVFSVFARIFIIPSWIDMDKLWIRQPGDTHFINSTQEAH